MYLMRKCAALALAVVLVTVVCLPMPVSAGEFDYQDNFDSVEQGGGELGRSMGGALGMAAGSIAGASLAAAVVKAAGIASLGPLATALTIAGITGCTLYFGSKIFSTLGQSLERSMGAKNMWTMVGAAIGAVACISLLGTAGVFAGPAGLLLKGLIGGLAGGTIARLLSGHLEFMANPRIMYPIVGGVIAAVGGLGIAGAIGGVALGYVMGSVMDKVYYAERDRTLRGYGDEGSNWAHSWVDRFQDWGRTVKNWISGGTDSVSGWTERNWDDDEDYRTYYDTGYNSAYSPTTDYDSPYAAFAPTTTSDIGVGDSRKEFHESYEDFEEANLNGDWTDRGRALKRYGKAYEEYRDDKTKALYDD